MGNPAHLWSEDYDRQLADVFTIQGEIAERVADALSVRLGGSERQRIEKKGTTNLDAYNSSHICRAGTTGMERGFARSRPPRFSARRGLQAKCETG